MELIWANNILLLLIVLFPLAGALCIGVMGPLSSSIFAALWPFKLTKRQPATVSRQTVVAIAVGSVALSFLCALAAVYALFHQKSVGSAPQLDLTLFRWFPLHGSKPYEIGVHFVLDALSGAITLVITGVGLLIHIYSAGYMSEERSYQRFFAYLNLFTAAMLILVLANNLPLLFVGWEGVGLCSYLLIGFWWKNPAYAQAGKKAFLYNRIGDFGVLIAMFLLFNYVGSLDVGEINNASPKLSQISVDLNLESLGIRFSLCSVATLICLCLFLGCTGKSAQLPLFVWLPDAMAGPTPVSALIHAATMVTAGVYLMCRLSQLFLASPSALAVIAVVGALTAFVAASIALVQTQLKKILAYSTVSQLGFMVSAVGVGAFAAGFFHVFTHAFFKACLFLGAGSVMHAVGAHGDASLRELGGLKKYQPVTHITFLISCLAIAGVPGLSGFFSKDEILLGVSQSADLYSFAPWLSQALFALLLITAGMTAFYMFRLYFLTFLGSYRGDSSIHPHESPPSMTVPLIVLAVGSAFSGYLATPHEWHLLPPLWSDWMSQSVVTNRVGEAFLSANMVMLLGSVAAVVGIGLAFIFYGRGEVATVVRKVADAMPVIRVFFEDKWKLDELYDVLVIRPAHRIARFAAIFDRIFVDGILARVSAALVRVASYFFTRFQTGYVQAYFGMLVLGLGVLGWWFVFPHVKIKTDVQGESVRFRFSEGYGYRVRLDFDGDGHFDTPWQATDDVLEHLFESSLSDAPIIRLTSPAPYLKEEVYELGKAETARVDADLLGSEWRSASGSNAAPVIRRSAKGAITLVPNNARVVLPNPGPSEKVPLKYSDRLMLGEATLEVGAKFSSVAQVKNIFGYIRTRTICIRLYRTTPKVLALAYGGEQK